LQIIDVAMEAKGNNPHRLWRQDFVKTGKIIKVEISDFKKIL